MYKSPIDVIYQDIERKFENYIVRAVQKCDINVDKDELVRALQYDREQYEKGYADGRACVKWIPCKERLPEEDKEVLISYRYKEGEGNPRHVDIDITTYGQMYFGGRKVGEHKHWRAPFEYFTSNYEVIAWMPLPEPYKGEE